MNATSRSTGQAVRPPNPIPLPPALLVPGPELFAHPSTIHGQEHVARVTVHAFALLERVGRPEEAPPLWAAVYLHDLARTHDGRCYVHGAQAVQRFETLPEVQALFARGGVRKRDYPGIFGAVERHSRPEELPADHPHYRLTALLKDADALDRVRIGDLNPAYLRFPESHALVPFAERLYDSTDGRWPPGERYFERLWGYVDDGGPCHDGR